MDHCQRILAAIRRQPLDRLPTDMWATPEVLEKLYTYFGIDSGREAAPGGGLCGGGLSRGEEALLALWDRLKVDGIVNIAPPYAGPQSRREGDVRYDEWGRGWRDQQYATGVYSEQVVYPLAAAGSIADLNAYRWPDPDWYDYSALPAIAARYPGRALCLGYTAPFYYYGMLRGLEYSMTDPVLAPDFAQALIGRLSDFFTEYHRRCFEAAGRLADVTQVTDDFGSQHGLLISPRIFDRFYRAPLQRAIDLAKSYGLLIFHHDDGDCRLLLPRLVEMGIDLLNPIQWRCGNWDLAALKAEYGARLCFHSAVDNQQTLAYGTPDDVRAEVKHLVETLGCDGTGFIIGPCHNLQAVSPVENIIALYEAAQEYGKCR